ARPMTERTRSASAALVGFRQSACSSSSSTVPVCSFSLRRMGNGMVIWPLLVTVAFITDKVRNRVRNASLKFQAVHACVPRFLPSQVFLPKPHDGAGGPPFLATDD